MPAALPTGDVFALTAALVDVASESFHEQEIVSLLEAELRSCAHLTVDRVGDNLVARTRLGRGRRLILGGHTDTVPANDNAGARIVGDRMYQSNYDAGFRVLDISDPERPVEIGYFDTSPYQGGASWSNYPYFESGIIAVTGTGDGLFILKDVSRRLIS